MTFHCSLSHFGIQRQGRYLLSMQQEATRPHVVGLCSCHVMKQVPPIWMVQRYNFFADASSFIQNKVVSFPA